MTEFLLIKEDLNHLEEIGLFPIINKLEFYGYVSGIALYSNETIVNKVKEHVLKQRKEIYNIVSKGLDSKNIIVGYTSPSKFKFVFNKIKKLTGFVDEVDLGFYDKIEDKLCVVLDHNVNMLGKTLIKIDSILVHELVHCAASKNNKTNIILNTSEHFIYPFFKSLLSNLYNIVIEEDEKLNVIPYGSDFNRIMMDLNKKIEKDVSITTHNGYYISSQIWNNEFVKRLGGNKENARILTRALQSMYNYNYLNSSLSVFSDNELKKINDSFYKAYNNINIKNPNTLVGQEPIYPSEIISIYSRINPTNPNIVNSLNKIVWS